MEFCTKSGSPEKLRTSCIVAGIFESRKLSSAAAVIDRASRKHMSKILAAGDMDGKAGSTLLLHGVPGVSAERVLLIGLGKEKVFGDKEYRAAIACAARKLAETGAAEACLYVAALPPKKRDVAWKARQAAIVASGELYRFERMKSKPDDSPPQLRQLCFGIEQREGEAKAAQGMAEGAAIAAGMDLARDLGNLPGNVCTPSYLADQGLALGKTLGLAVDVLEREDMEKLGMNTLLSVSRGSHEPPKFIILRHSGGSPKAKPVVLVGKGITFDSGGISLKPGAEMDEMKFDMCGAASVLGTVKAAAIMKLPLNIVGVIPATENMPGGRASKPGDIVRSMSGKTVEILNTDAEGRLILCDALTYVERFEPDCVVDVATLTGACVIALGNVTSGLLANDDDLARELLDAGQESYDRAWQLPLHAEYQEQLKSNFADMANIGGRPAGTITAACFLSRFTDKYRWAHLDIAGTAWRSGKEKGATGRPIPLLAHFLIARARRSAKRKGK